jgi:hypothetical protein
VITFVMSYELLYLWSTINHNLKNVLRWHSF